MQDRGDLNERLASILVICRKMNSERDLGALLDLIAHEATTLLNADRASIFLLDKERNELWSKVALGSDEILRFDARLGVVGQAALTGETIFVHDAYRDPRFYNAIDDQTGYRTRNLIAVGLRNQRGELIGAFEVLNKKHGTFNSRDEEVLTSLAAHAGIAIETAQLIEELKRHQNALAQQNASLMREVEQKFGTHRIIGTSARIQSVVRLIERIRDSNVNVLITGESGTGKEMAAKAIHFTSNRAAKPFVALNCAALPETLVESELFGIEKGVATGVNPRVGQFQTANGGTLFLDEVGDLSLTAQAKILRVLQERMVEKVGARSPIPVDVRVLAATNKDLEAEIGKGNFREDLYYRLKVIHIHLPPLREIRQDIPLLATHFLREHSREMHRGPMEIAPSLMQKLVNKRWPGNIRQLNNEVNRLVACARGPLIADDEPWEVLPAPAVAAPPAGRRGKTLKAAIEELERSMVQEALQSCRNNQQQAAKSLGLSRQGLINKMKRYRIGSADSAYADA